MYLMAQEQKRLIEELSAMLIPALGLTDFAEAGKIAFNILHRLDGWNYVQRVDLYFSDLQDGRGIERVLDITVQKREGKSSFTRREYVTSDVVPENVLRELRVLREAQLPMVVRYSWVS
jgi:hypothetical protein